MQHSFKDSLLATVIIENEKRHSKDEFDAYLILKAVLIHDLGEIGKGDILYRDKNMESDKQEHSIFKDLIAALPEDTQNELDVAFNLQHARSTGFSQITDELKKRYPIEIKLFDAIERLGYVLFAYGEYNAGKGIEILIQVLRNQHSYLIRLANDLPGFGKVFYNKDIQKSIQDFLKKYEGQFIEKN